MNSWRPTDSATSERCERVIFLSSMDPELPLAPIPFQAMHGQGPIELLSSPWAGSTSHRGLSVIPRQLPADETSMHHANRMAWVSSGTGLPAIGWQATTAFFPRGATRQG